MAMSKSKFVNIFLHNRLSIPFIPIPSTSSDFSVSPLPTSLLDLIPPSPVSSPIPSASSPPSPVSSPIPSASSPPSSVSSPIPSASSPTLSASPLPSPASSPLSFLFSQTFGTTTAPTSVPTTILKFELPSIFIACSSSVIYWNYTGESTPVKLTLVVDNHVPQDVPPPHFINKMLSSQIDPTSGSFLWPSVNVPQGWYQLLASIPQYGQVNQTSTFYVEEGTDTSCFITSPVTEPGVVAGAAAGGVAVTICLCIGYLYAYRRRRKLQSFISLRIKEMVTHLRPTCFDSVASAHPDMPQNFEKIQECEINNASDSGSPHGHSPRTTALAPDGLSYPERAVASTYSRSGSSMNSLESYPNPCVDGRFMPDLTLSYAGSHLSPRLSSWSFTAVSQLNARASAVDAMSYSSQDAASNHSTFSTTSTALPLYRSPTTTSTLPPSFHTSER